MTKTTRSDRAALDRLADALIEDLLATRDAELLAETQVDGDSGVASARAAFRRATVLSQLAAKASVRRRAGDNVRALDAKTARRRLEEFIAGDGEAADELTEAARKVGRLSDEDVYGVLERLQGRGIEQRGRDHDGR